MNRDRSIVSSVLVLILVPAVVSLAVTWLVLTIWGGPKEPEVIMLPTFSGTALIPPATRPATTPGTQQAPTGSEGPSPGEEETEEPVECENPVHVVASGETLGLISQQYGIAIEDITLMNQMLDAGFDPDFISVDQEIVIPVCGVPTPSPEPEPSNTAVPTRSVPTPNPTSTDLPAGLVIVEVARVLNPGDITSEAVEIINRGTSVARMGGWTLSNRRGDRFELPPLNLFPQGAVTIYTGVGQNTAIDIYWGRDRAVWLPGETVRISNASGDLQFEYEIPEE
jgi:LysM repeat protein